MPEFSESKIINHSFRINQTKDHKYGSLGYDMIMIIGHNLLRKLGIQNDFANDLVHWGESKIPMKHSDFEPDTSTSKKSIHKIIKQTVEPTATQEATEQVICILNSNYEKADLKEVVANAHQLNNEEKGQLLTLLRDFEDIFDGTLGYWDTGPVNIELKPNATPYNGRYSPVPKINKETFRKELMRLVEIGVLTPAQQSEYGTPVFIIPNKEGTVCFVTDFRKVNQTIV